MQYPIVNVNGVSVRVDREGRYSLNDLHEAAVLKGEATSSQRPSNFIKSAQVKRFAHELSEATNVASIKTIKGGTESGAWGLELIAIRYAAWLSPKFEIRVYNTFRDAVLGGISSITMLNRLDLLISNEKQEVSACARKMNQWGVGGNKRMLESTRQNLINQMDPDMVAIMQGLA
ncbi:KilA-N domain-containing protein [Scandinavium goeteborgense]|uniref:KilA-N domain-containing protein n=1 Tax=Scandinavium goeteborgense TaxID=1851514 RepID=UPI000F677466|nr:KilA-N domain-containing protein [Scandinavium goeteborgense]QKN80782.1 KilA-N domain-containing protein [Scandinavium goeteborgense]